MWLLSRHLLSRGLLGEDLDDCWQTEDSWGGLMTELFNGRETDIAGNDVSMLFEWQSLRLDTRLSRGVVRRLPWLSPVPLLCHLPIPFLERGMMNKIWVCGDIVCMIFYFSIAIIRWKPNVLARQLQSFFDLSTRNKNWLRAFDLKIILIRL